MNPEELIKIIQALDELVESATKETVNNRDFAGQNLLDFVGEDTSDYWDTLPREDGLLVYGPYDLEELVGAGRGDLNLVIDVLTDEANEDIITGFRLQLMDQSSQSVGGPNMMRPDIDEIFVIDLGEFSTKQEMENLFTKTLDIEGVTAKVSLVGDKLDEIFPNSTASIEMALTNQGPVISDRLRRDLNRDFIPPYVKEALEKVDAEQAAQYTELTGDVEVPDTVETAAKDVVPDDISSIDTPTNVVDDFKLSGTMGGNTTPTGVNIAYANVEDLEQFIQFDRKAEGNLERINNIKETILDKGYLYDTAYEGGVVFGVIVDEAGNVQIPEGNHRLQALIDVAKETGQEIYVPINPMLTSTGGGNKVQLTSSDNAYNSMKQLLTDMLEGNKNFNVERTISEKLGEPGTRIIGLDSYTYPGGAPGTSTTQSNIKKFFNSIGINAITYDELPDNNIYKTGANTFTDTPTNVVDEVAFNKSEAIDNVNNLVDELPLEETFKKQVKKNTARIGKNVATPGGVIDFIDAWELGVLALAVAAISTNEVDEIPTIIYNQGVKMYNSMLSFVGIPGQVQEKPYNINFEKAIKTFNIAEMFMPTAYVEKAAVKEFKKGQEAGVDISVGLGAGAGVPPMQFKGQEPKQDNGDINNIMVNLMKNISNAQKSYPITSSEMSNFNRNPIQVVAQDTADKPVKIKYDSKEKQKINDIYAKLYKNLSNAGARVQ